MKLAAVVVFLALAYANAIDLNGFIAKASKVALKHQDLHTQQYEALFSGRRSLQDFNACLQASPGCDPSGENADIDSDDCKALINCIASQTFAVLDGCFAEFGALGAYFQCMIGLTGVDTDAIAASETILGTEIDFADSNSISGDDSAGNASSSLEGSQNTEFLQVIQSGATPSESQCTSFYAANNVAAYATLTCLAVLSSIEDASEFSEPPVCLLADPSGGEPEDIFAGEDSGDGSDPSTLVTDIGLNDTTLANLKAAVAACDSAVPDIDLTDTIDDALGSSAIAYSVQLVSFVAALAMTIMLA